MPLPKVPEKLEGHWKYREGDVFHKVHDLINFSEQLVAYLRGREVDPMSDLCFCQEQADGEPHMKHRPSQEPPQEKCWCGNPNDTELIHEKDECYTKNITLPQEKTTENYFTQDGGFSLPSANLLESSPFQQTVFEKEVAKLPQDGKWRQLNLVEKAWVKDRKVGDHSIQSFVDGLVTRPSQQIDVEESVETVGLHALLREYAQTDFYARICDEKNDRSSKEMHQKRMSEIEEIIKNNLK